MNKLATVVLNQELVDKFLEEIDTVASFWNSYEYGLPLTNEGERAQLREVVYKFVAKLEKEAGQ
jgi:hypothetical protein